MDQVSTSPERRFSGFDLLLWGGKSAPLSFGGAVAGKSGSIIICISLFCKLKRMSKKSVYSIDKGLSHNKAEIF